MLSLAGTRTRVTGLRGTVALPGRDGRVPSDSVAVMRSAFLARPQAPMTQVMGQPCTWPDSILSLGTCAGPATAGA